ncbi:MAG: TIGR00730 family Rossman fold protein [Burkholderiales bacterium]|nr:TIGR00730 family Rossman fold protein [Burkholderiales bacterium]
MKRICVFCGSNAGKRAVYAHTAADLGRAFAARKIGLIYGGGSVGLMKIAAEAALAAGGEVIGVITEQLMVREVGHPGLSRLEVVPTMHERKALMASLADAFVALPGGFGTFDELCEMATWDQLGIHAKPLALVNVEGYFDGFLAQLDRGVADGFLRSEHRAMIEVVTRVTDLFDALARWHGPPAGNWLVDPPPKP